MRFVPQGLRRGPWRTLPDRDILQSLAVAVLASVATAGVLPAGYFVWAWHIAVVAPKQPRRGRSLLLFGKRLVSGGVDADFRARVARAHEAMRAGACDRVILLGGASTGSRSEAAAAFAELQRLGVPAGVDILLDETSLDTLENLRNARGLLGVHAREPVTLLSSRYHLPRCAFIARSLGLDYELCAAEDTFVARGGSMRRLALEAAYIMWTDIGLRWARLLGLRGVIDQMK